MPKCRRIRPTCGKHRNGRRANLRSPPHSPPTEEDADDNPAFGKLAGLVLDMKLLAEADTKTLLKQLEPLVTAYRDWIDREEPNSVIQKEGLAQFGDAGRVAIDNCRSTIKRIEEGVE